MAKETAADIVRQIRVETARRKRIWRLMRIAGFEAVKAVRAHAQSQGVKTLEWFGGALSDEQVRVFYQIGGSRSRVKSFALRRDGRVLDEGIKDATYENYPDLTDKDPAAFERAAVEKLMENFNGYREEQRNQRRRRRGR